MTITHARYEFKDGKFILIFEVNGVEYGFQTAELNLPNFKVVTTTTIKEVI